MSLAWKNAWRNKRRSILTILSLGASLFLLTTLRTVLYEFEFSSGSPKSALRVITLFRNERKPSRLQWAEAPDNFVACVERNSHSSALVPLLNLFRHGGCGRQDEGEDSQQGDYATGLFHNSSVEDSQVLAHPLRRSQSQLRQPAPLRSAKAAAGGPKQDRDTRRLAGGSESVLRVFFRRSASGPSGRTR